MYKYSLFAAVFVIVVGLSSYGVAQENTSDAQNQQSPQTQPSQTLESSEAVSDPKKRGEDFLEANKEKEGIHVTSSGLQYKVVTIGQGEMPTSDDTVRVHYRGTLIDGNEFDSSYSRGQPAEFPLNGVIRGWTEGLQLMKEGSKYTFYIPSDLAYGERGSPPRIPGDSVLIFDIELLKVIHSDQKRRGEDFLRLNMEQEGVHVTSSGLQYKVITMGEGEIPRRNDTVRVHYRGTFIDGDEFDSSYRRGRPIKFPLNRVIRGWTEGLQLMKEGSKYTFYIPSDLAYGERGVSPRIPGDSVLIFDVELLEVIRNE